MYPIHIYQKSQPKLIVLSIIMVLGSAYCAFGPDDTFYNIIGYVGIIFFLLALFINIKKMIKAPKTPTISIYPDHVDILRMANLKTLTLPLANVESFGIYDVSGAKFIKVNLNAQGEAMLKNIGKIDRSHIKNITASEMTMTPEEILNALNQALYSYRG